MAFSTDIRQCDMTDEVKHDHLIQYGYKQAYHIWEIVDSILCYCDILYHFTWSIDNTTWRIILFSHILWMRSNSFHWLEKWNKTAKHSLWWQDNPSLWNIHFILCGSHATDWFPSLWILFLLWILKQPVMIADLFQWSTFSTAITYYQV